MKSKNVIFDIGANDGIDSINYAVFNPKFTIYAFEPNPFLKSRILNNKKKIEIKLNYKINNLKIINKAVSDFNGIANFYIAKEDLCSSLLKYDFIPVNKKIKVEVITLESFCNIEKIDNIIYLHIDTQGSDLRVLFGLNNYRNNLVKGVLEAPRNIKFSRYKNSHSISIVKKYFIKWKYKITKVEPNHLNHNEYNIYFSNSLF